MYRAGRGREAILGGWRWLSLWRSASDDYDETVRTERNLVRLLNEAKKEAFELNRYERDYMELKRPTTTT